MFAFGVVLFAVALGSSFLLLAYAIFEQGERVKGRSNPAPRVVSYERTYEVNRLNL